MNTLLIANNSSASQKSATGNKNTVMLVAGESSPALTNNLSNAIGDTSSNAITMTASGTAAIGTFSPYGSNWSVYFSGSSTRLSYAYSNKYAFTGDFTVELWINPVSPSGYDGIIACATNGSSLTAGWQIIYNNSSSTLRFECTNNQPLISGSKTVPIGTWTHVAVTRHGSTVSLWINGVLDSTGTYSGTLDSTNQPLLIGVDRDTSTSTYPGTISNVRIVNGTALYTTSFTPPTSKLTAVTNTVFLLNGNSFSDASGNAGTLTVGGSPIITRFSPFTTGNPTAYSPTSTGTSVYFNGTSSYLNNSTAQSSMNFGTGDYTVEMWVYMTAGTSSNGYTLIDTRNASMTGNGYVLWLNASNVVTQQYNNGSNNYGGSTAIIPYTWNHIAWSRTSGTARIFVNGVLVSTYTDTNNYSNNATFISRNNANSLGFVNGYIADVRVTGSGLYTASFTLPTSPLTVGTSTKFLLGSQQTTKNWCEIYDATGNSNIYVTGGPTISNAQSKFNGTSIYNGSSLTSGYTMLSYFPTPTLFSFGTGDFTIEGWIYWNSLTGSPSIIDTRPSTTAYGWAFGVGNVNSNELYFGWGEGSGSMPHNGLSPALNSGAWNHCAVVRHNGTTTVYLNGTAGSSFADSQNYVCTGIMSIGSSQSYADNYVTPGYLSDVRISKSAIYTSNFTPPTKSLVGQ